MSFSVVLSYFLFSLLLLHGGGPWSDRSINQSDWPVLLCNVCQLFVTMSWQQTWHWQGAASNPTASIYAECQIRLSRLLFYATYIGFRETRTTMRPIHLLSVQGYVRVATIPCLKNPSCDIERMIHMNWHCQRLAHVLVRCNSTIAQLSVAHQKSGVPLTET